MPQHFITHQLEQKENDYAFKTGVILPFGTNFPLGVKLGAEAEEEKLPEEKLLLPKIKAHRHEEGGGRRSLYGLTERIFRWMIW